MSRLNVIVNQFGDRLGRSLPKAKLYSYEVGSNIEKPLYSDAALTQPRVNPTEADGAGRFFDIFVDSGGYRLELRDQFDNFVWEQDDYFASVDGTDIANIESDIQANSQAITENIASYNCAQSAPDVYDLTIKGGLAAPAQYRQGTKILFTPDVANAGDSSVNVEGLGIVGLRDFDNVTLLPAGFLSVTSVYAFEYDGSTFKFLWKSGDSISIGDLPNLTEGRVWAGNASNRPIEVDIPGWRAVETVDLTNGGLNDTSSWNVSGIPESSTALKLVFSSVQVSVGSSFFLQIGDSGGLDVAGYESGARSIASSTSTGVSSTSYRIIALASSPVDVYRGELTLELESGNTWIMTSTFSNQTSLIQIGSGEKTLSNNINQIEFLSNSGNFTGGSMTVWSYS